jgi:hypothetical protein
MTPTVHKVDPDHITTGDASEEALERCMSAYVGVMRDTLKTMMRSTARQAIEQCVGGGFLDNKPPHAPTGGLACPEYMAEMAWVKELNQRIAVDGASGTFPGDTKQLAANQWRIAHERHVKQVAAALRKCCRPFG